MTASDGTIILGIDPGLAVTGYGLIAVQGDSFRMLECGVIRLPRRLAHPERLRRLHESISEVIATGRPHEVAVEDFFVGHVRSAVAIGEARAMAILAAAQSGLPVSLYKPLEVKQFVTSYGRGSKEQVQEMVRALLCLEEPPQPMDAADALAVALCHCLKRGRASTLDPRRSTRALSAGRGP